MFPMIVLVPFWRSIHHHPSAFWIAQLCAIGCSVAVGVQGRQLWPPNHVTGFAGCGEEVGDDLHTKRIEWRAAPSRVAGITASCRAAGNLPYALAARSRLIDHHAGQKEHGHQ